MSDRKLVVMVAALIMVNAVVQVTVFLAFGRTMLALLASLAAGAAAGTTTIAAITVWTEKRRGAAASANEGRREVLNDENARRLAPSMGRGVGRLMLCG
jgi:hypothetical protein